VTRISVLGPQAFRSSGRIHQYGVMANAFYDFNSFSAMGPVPAFVPYVGLGAGYVWSDWRRVGGVANLGLGRTGAFAVDDRDGRFAYQGIAGVAFNLGAVMPGLSLTAEYRFLGTLEPKLSSAVAVAVPGRQTERSEGRYEPENYNHSVLLGLRYAFNAPRPAPVVAVAPAPQRPPRSRAPTWSSLTGIAPT
jgi:opacity protein-like surface antigen